MRRSGRLPGRSARSVARSLVAPVTAVATVAGFIALLLFVNSSPSPHGGPVVAGPAVSPSHSRVPTPRPPARRLRAAITEHPTKAPAKPPLTVLNNSRRTGLAHAVAQQLSDGGWSVAEIGNFTGRIPVTTVYYGSHERAAAQRLAAQFSHIARVLPRFSGLPGAGLTVVVTREYPVA